MSPRIELPDGSVAWICGGGSVQRIRDAAGKAYLFEMHHFCGPNVIGQRSLAPLARQPGPRSPFWPAVEAWIKQGRQVEDGWAIWRPER